MSWIMELVKTYDAHEDLVGKENIEGSKAVLMPICHVVQKAQIEVTIDGEGNFSHASVLPKAEQSTLLPCTPASEVRTSNLAPHPLHDKLIYIARDGDLYREERDKKGRSPYSLYVELLGKWVHSPYSIPKVEAVYKYVTQHDIIDDLCRANPPVLYRDDKGNIMQKWPYKDRPKPDIFSAVSDDILKALVRFRVIHIPGDNEPDLWKDQDLQRQYIAFFKHEFSKDLELCYATGKMMRPAGKQGKRIRSPKDKSKLISSNDTKGLTFRGRFKNAHECLSLGHETLQKATNALAWLIRNQGHDCEGRVFLAWSSSTPLPDILSATNDVIGDEWSTPLEITQPQTLTQWVESFDRAIKGYYHNFEKDPNAKANVIVLDAITSGRLSICYYDEFSGRDFIRRIEKWHKSGRWIQHKEVTDNKEKKDKISRKSKKRILGYVGVPSPRTLIKACYGENVSDTKMKMELERIFNCIVQGRPLPIDMERCIVRRVVTMANTASGNKYYPWRHGIVEPACTVICNRWNGTHSKEEEYKVALDEKNCNRDYLFGRLLAVADQIERSTFKGKDKYSRLTNAMKYMEVFSMRPAKTWMTIHNRLLPYMQKQKEKHGSKELELLARITDLFQEEDFVSDAPLGSRFLLGFYSQQVVIQQESQDYTDSKNSQSGESDSADQSDEA
ncbi:MAG: type I-C CRISPR-associated protein Cas8c/Csd1 [Megasphaera massiliensis]|uniref:type I-C CRISPR-associated protein Cas8c/Csd1 n=2 Tax=Megasphaera TaxID=906 RepID=UPI00210DC2EF|nr:type I-C CRISPR-associated protein Cas8c/Csd1 [Megasphaera massiliensis]MCQ5209387.1 type I-C CRISPR-associated protein Cas8c/Csd1 [Megasphaera massiliensis]MEE0658868.1 type I-C CRISPR-associated protein Cas8c/Csd1 [Megasphaera massiliensis]